MGRNENGKKEERDEEGRRRRKEGKEGLKEGGNVEDGKKERKV